MAAYLPSCSFKNPVNIKTSCFVHTLCTPKTNPQVRNFALIKLNQNFCTNLCTKHKNYPQLHKINKSIKIKPAGQSNQEAFALGSMHAINSLTLNVWSWPCKWRESEAEATEPREPTFHTATLQRMSGSNEHKPVRPTTAHTLPSGHYSPQTCSETYWTLLTSC